MGGAAICRQVREVEALEATARLTPPTDGRCSPRGQGVEHRRLGDEVTCVPYPRNALARNYFFHHKELALLHKN